jgi:hypothetical protein
MTQVLPDDVRTGGVGRFVDASTLLLTYGCPRELLRRMTTARALLAIPSASGELAFPAFQFDADGEPLPGLPLVLHALDPAGDHPLRAAVWLTTPSTRLGGRAPAAALRDGRVDEVLAAAAAGLSA